MKFTTRIIACAIVFVSTAFSICSADFPPEFKQMLTSSVWQFGKDGGYSRELRFHPDGTGTATGFSGGFRWRLDENSGTVKIDETGETPRMSAHLELTFYANSTRFSWYESRFKNRGDGRREDQSAAVVPSTPSATPWIAVFAREFSKASGWATLPLSNAVPGTVRDEIAALQGSLRDEAAKTPQASAQAYGYADLICRNLLFDLDDRDNTMQQNKQNAAGKLTDSWMSAWATKSARYRAVLRANFDQFVAAVRQSEKPKLPVPAGMVASVDLPPVPAAAGMPASDFKADPNNPLNRGAYDRHPIWWSPWWGYYRR